MNTLKRVLRLIVMILLAVSWSACGKTAQSIPTLAPTWTVTQIPSHTLIPSITLTLSPIPTTTPSPTNIPATATPDFCDQTQWQGNIQILSTDVLTSFEPGGPILFDQILVEHNPAWADFRQYDHEELRTAGVIFHETAFGPELGTGINPAVILVTYGVERDWQLPANADLVSEVDRIRAVLFMHHSDFVHGKVDPNQYPVGNLATYVLYRYFNRDISKLEDWCHTYVQVYGESPLK